MVGRDPLAVCPLVQRLHSCHGTNAGVAVGSLLLVALLSLPSSRRASCPLTSLLLSRQPVLHHHDSAVLLVPLTFFLEPRTIFLPRSKASPPVDFKQKTTQMDARPPHLFSHRAPAPNANGHSPQSPPQHPPAPSHFGNYASATSQPPVHVPFSADPYPSARRDPFFPHAAGQHARHMSGPEHAPPTDRQYGWGGTGTLDSSLETFGTEPHKQNVLDDAAFLRLCLIACAPNRQCRAATLKRTMLLHSAHASMLWTPGSSSRAE